MKKWIMLFSFLLSSVIYSNNLLLENISLVNQSSGSHTFVKFDISWENSWRGGTDNGNNWDAAWVFLKYKVSGGEWQHATLNTSGHTTPASSIIETSSDGKGIFIYRDANGTGSNNWDGIELKWNYFADGVSDDADVTVKVFSIEMVYVPEGSFNVGDGTSVNISAQLESGISGLPFQITGEGSITLGGGTAGSLGNNNKTGQYTSSGSGDDFDDITSQTLPATFPKGYNAFYIMKHEIPQKLYVDFLNCLTRAQQNTRTEVDISGANLPTELRYVMMGTATKYRNSIVCDTDLTPIDEPITFYLDNNGDFTLGDGGDIAMNFLSWEDSKAFADWAGMRPMTELEFEKTCRGTIPAVPNEYAWGTILITTTRYSILNSGANNESVILDNLNSNVCYESTYDNSTIIKTGPFRCGIFSDQNGTRVRSGATYYGVMEMSGNVTEQIISVSNSSSRIFDGTHGDGDLNSSGNADVLNWPTNYGIKGNGFLSSAQSLRISEREYNYVVGFNSRYNLHGFRAVRTAP